MNIHEYQARELLARAGIPVPPGMVAATPAEARRAVERLGVPKAVVKAQVHAGGRGKAGGVKLVESPEQAERAASQILGMQIKGLPVTKVLIVPAAEIASEAYVGVIVDRVSRSPVLMVSPAGGIDIEEVAATTPEKIYRATVDARYGLLPHQAMALAFRLYDDIALVRQAAGVLQKLYLAFVEAGASLAEINPLVVTPGGEVVALDAKIVVDDNELERRPAVAALRDVAVEDPAEVQARDANLTYIKLDGNVGCCVNGAGLAMATMDLVKYYGGEPANFLDIGGSSNPDKVVTALKIITADAKVKAILFNIFGGITRCDDVANGIVAATRQFKVERPIVIRLTGTNEKEAVQILEGVGMRALTDMDAAVEQAVKVAKGGAAA
jgi:succinyl-CoA synthetase beta subunit